MRSSIDPTGGATLTDAASSPQARTAPSAGLTVDERRYLMAWIETARASGIDATEDLRLRPWPVPNSVAVIGVFRAGESIATWLVVGQNGLWTVIVVASGHIVTTQPALSDALAAIHQPAGDMARQSPGPFSFR